jgi:hypothetical protein
MREIPADVLAPTLRHIAVAARRHNYADDVEALAVRIVANLYGGTDTDDDDPRALATRAVHMAGRTVALAHAGVDSLDAWAGEESGMVDVIEHAGIDRANMPRLWCPAPEDSLRTTDRDVWRMALATVKACDVEAWRVLRDASRAYVAHDTRPCDVCATVRTTADHDLVRTGRRVSLAGILAHTRGLVASDSQYHALRRLTLGAVAKVDTRRVRAVAYGVAGDAHRGDWAPGARVRTGSPLAPVKAPTADALATWRAEATRTAQARDVARVRLALAYMEGASAQKSQRVTGETLDDVREAYDVAAREATRAADRLARGEAQARRAARRTGEAPRAVEFDPLALARELAPLTDAWRARLTGEPIKARAPRMRPADVAPGKRETAARGLPDTDAVRITRPGKAPRTVSESEDIAPKRSPRTGEDRRAEAIAGAPSRAVRRQERTRGNGGTGAYGSQVGARATHAAPWRP